MHFYNLSIDATFICIHKQIVHEKFHLLLHLPYQNTTSNTLRYSLGYIYKM